MRVFRHVRYVGLPFPFWKFLVNYSSVDRMIKIRRVRAVREELCEG